MLRHYPDKCQKHTPPEDEIFPRILQGKRKEQCSKVNIHVYGDRKYFLKIKFQTDSDEVDTETLEHRKL